MDEFPFYKRGNILCQKHLNAPNPLQGRSRIPTFGEPRLLKGDPQPTTSNPDVREPSSVWKILRNSYWVTDQNIHTKIGGIQV